MLSDEELVDRLRSELAPLLPPADLAERVREQGRADRRLLGRVDFRGRTGRVPLRAATVGVAACVLLAVTTAVALFALTGAGPKPANIPVGRSRTSSLVRTPGGRSPRSTRRPAGSVLAVARPGAGRVTCRRGVCRQGRRLVRNPSGMTCGHGQWVANTTARETVYGCHHQAVAGY